MRSLLEAFDPKRNALNAARFGLAIGVIGWHSFALTGSDPVLRPADLLMRNFFVDGFFGISGFLIVASWLRTPNWRVYTRARLLRILPAFYVCLIVTAALFAPLSLLLDGRRPDRLVFESGISYVLRNSFLQLRQYGIDGTLADVPFPGIWNASLWTLWWEFLLYVTVLILGVFGLFRFKALIPGLLALSALGLVLTSGLGETDIPRVAARFGTMFFAGALLYQLRKFVPASWLLVGLASTFILVTLLLPYYLPLSALPVAYVVITSAALCRVNALRLPHDFSYGMYIYAFPVQQLLVIVCWDDLSLVFFFLLSFAAALPFAVASWFLVERPFLRMKAGRRAQLANPHR